MALLTDEELDAIQDAMSTAGLISPQVRGALMRTVHPDYVGLLSVFDKPALQFRGDLRDMSDVERLTDGSVPLQSWLREAVRLLRPRKEADVLAALLDKVSARASGAPAMPAAAKSDVPPDALRKLEELVQENDMLPFWFLARGHEAGAAVAKLRVRRHDNGKPAMLNGHPYIMLGTGWMIAPDLLITNHHVINARSDGEPNASAADLALQGQNTTAQFDFDDDGVQGVSIASTRLEAHDKALDYAILRLAENPGRTPFRLADQPVQQPIGDLLAANIIQHPGGEPKKVALRNNVIYKATDQDVRYFTDTQRGSSGSPVCDDQWRVMALHKQSEIATGVVFQGRPAGYVNAGTQIRAILDHLATHYAAIRKAIT